MPKAGPRRILRAAPLGLALLFALPAAAQIHPSELPHLTADAAFPRCTASELVEVGFPDHKHEQYWPGHTPPVGPDGLAYGYQSMCAGGEVIPRPGLVIEPDSKAYGPFTIRHSTVYRDCDMIMFIELLDWAWHEVPDLLGLSSDGRLTIVNPDNNPEYEELTGQGIWRFYLLEGERCVMEPWPILQRRTLDGHAAFMLVTDWLLRENCGDRLPPWLRQGLVEYCGEHGTHLVNYMAQFRVDGPVLYSPPLIDHILSSPLDPDPERDREVYRKACYSAFLMVWELVENRGGLQAMREFLAAVRDGQDADQALLQTYGLGLEDLAVSLDPASLGEPGGKNPKVTNPNKRP